MASVSKRKWTHNGVTREAWVTRWIDDQGVHRSKTFDQKKGADAFRRQTEREIEDGVHVAANASRTVKEAAQALLKVQEDRLAMGQIGRSHYANAEGVLRLYIIPQLGAITLRDLTPDRVADFARGLRKEGKKPASVRKYLAVMRLMEKLARKRGWIKTQPVADAIVELPRSAATRIETFTPDEVKTLLLKSGERGFQMNARPTAAMELAVHLAALCGLRMGEILGLPLDAIDLDKRQLVVRQAISRFYEIKAPKTPAGYRAVPIPNRLMILLREWIDEHYVPSPDRLLLRGVKGLIPRQSNLRVQWYALLKRCGLPVRNFHALRHFYASWHIANGTPAPDTAKLLGHAQFDMTLRVYTHALLTDESCNAQADRIAGMLIPACANDAQIALTN